MENKLIMSQKEECDNYNLITEIIDKLVDMCDNAEAIALRDELFELFTTKYSEPLYEILGLQEEIGCPVDVYVNATINGIIVNGEWFSVKIHKDNYGYYFALSNGSAYPFYLSSYQKTWWLKKDKSE